MVVAPELIHRTVGEAIFVLMADSSVHWFKNDTAVVIWTALADAGETGTTAASIAQHLTQRFAVSNDDALADASEFLSAMLERDLLRVKFGQAPGP